METAKYIFFPNTVIFHAGFSAANNHIKILQGKKF